jgi:hypothetical protein
MLDIQDMRKRRWLPRHAQEGPRLNRRGPPRSGLPRYFYCRLRNFWYCANKSSMLLPPWP